MVRWSVVNNNYSRVGSVFAGHCSEAGHRAVSRPRYVNCIYKTAAPALLPRTK